MSEPDAVINVDFIVDSDGVATAADALREGSEKATASARRMTAGFDKATGSASHLSSNISKINSGLSKAGREAFLFQRAMDAVDASQLAIVQGLRNLQSEISSSKTLQRQVLIDQRLAADRARQGEAEAARAANARLNIETQKAAQSQLIAQRQAGQQRIQLTRAVLENIGRLEKGLGAVIAGTARTATGAAGRVFDSLTAKIRNTNRVFTEGTSTALSRREQLIRGSFSRQERLLSETVSRQSRTIQQLNRQVSGGVLGGVTGRGAGAGLGGVAGGVGIASLLTSGFQRFSDLERINKQFLALTQSIEDTELLLGQIEEFAKTTPFDLVGVADLAKGFLAIGTATEDVLPRVTAIADAVALTGGGVDELNRIQRAIGQVVSAGRLQGDELNQLAENLPALNIRQILADQLTGGNVAQLVEMQEAGEITSDLFVTGLITGLQQDERLVGASQDLAETLGGRVANLKESFADFGASLIGSIADPLKIAVLGAQTTLQGLANFVKGDVGPGLLLLREAAKGAAIGLGAIVAAKGAAETLKLVGVAARLLLTPFGAVLTAAALLGAGLNVMLERSEALRATMGALRERVSLAAREIGQRAAPLIGRLGDFIATTLLPAIDSLASFLARNLLGALDAVVGFVRSTAIPALERFARFVMANVLPPLLELGRTVAGAFVAAKNSVVGFAEDALPRLQSLATKVGEVGRKVAETIGGNRLVAAAGAGLAGFVVGGPIGGIVAAFASLADKIVPALKPVGEKIREFFVGIFTRENLISVGKGALQVVETIGFTLGSIVTNPKFVTALAAIAAAAALVAIRFVEGFGRAFLENIPGLASLIGQGVTELVKVAFNPEVIGLAIIGGFAATRIIGPLISQFRSVGEQSGGSFASGFRTKSQGFLSTLFGGPGAAQSNAAKRQFADFRNEIDLTQRQLRRLGSSFEVNPRNVQQAQQEIARLSDGLTRGELAALRYRDRLNAAFVAAGGISKGVREVGVGLGQIASGFANTGRTIGSALNAGLQNAALALAKFFSAGTRQQATFEGAGRAAGIKYGEGLGAALRQGGATIAGAFRVTLSGLRQIAREQGIGVGQAVASGLAVGFGAFVAGRAEGQAGGSGALSAIGAGLTGLAVGGPIVGAAAAGLSLVGTAFGKAKKAAEDARKRVQDFADVIKGDLVSGLSAGADGLLSFAEALDGVAATDKLKANLDDIAGSLNEAGVSFAEVRDAFAAEDLSGIVAKIFQADLGGDRTIEVLQRLTQEYGDFAGAVEKANDARVFSGDAARDRSLNAEALRLEALAGAYGVTNPRIEQFNDLVSGEVQPRFTDAMQGVLDDAKVKADAVSAAIDSIFGNRSPEGLAASFDAAILSVAGQFTDLKVGGGLIDQAALDTALNDLKSQLSGVTEAGINEGAIFDEGTLRAQTLGVLGAALDAVEDPAVRAAITQAYEDGVASALPILNTANIYDQLAAGLTEPLVVDTELSDSGLKADAARLAALARSYGEDIGGDLGRGVAAGIDLTKLIIRKSAEGAVTSAANAMRGIAEIQSPSKVTRRIGGFMAEGLALGIAEGSAMASEAANQLTFAALNGFGALKSSGYSFGRDIGQAIVDGLADTEADMTSVVSDAVSAALASIGTLGDPLRNATSSAASQLFGGVTGSDRTVPGGKGGDVAGTQANITQGLQGFLSTFDSNVSQIFEVNAKKLKDLSATEREIFGTDVFSLDVSTVFGASNVTALTSSLDSIAAFGEAIIAQGVPLDQVSAKLQMYIDDLVTTATNLGFNQDQLLDLVATLGLSDAAIDDFINKVNDLTTTAASATPTPKPEDATYFRPVQNFIIQLPTGDPRAAALAVANSQAAAAELP